MKILYAIQGTGNGHVSRARDIVPLLAERGELDLLLSGTQADVQLGSPLTYRCQGLSFVFGKDGGIDFWATYRQARLLTFLGEARTLPVRQYDVVINDFEPVSAWACRWQGLPCIGLSHQSAVLAPAAPRPAYTDWVGNFVLGNYAPTDTAYGFHFQAFDERVFTPVIRQQVRALTSSRHGHYTVYLPAYADQTLVVYLTKHFPEIRWHIFSKHSKTAYQRANLWVFPIQNETFLDSMATAEGILCGAGFETPAEALFLGKKLLVIPMRGQYEQHCNAAALAQMGVPVLPTLDDMHRDRIGQWLASDEVVRVHYPDQTAEIIDRLFREVAALVAPA